MVCILSIVLGPSARITHVIRYIAYIGLFGKGKCRFIQVLYLGRAPRTKETLPDFREKCRVTRLSRVFRGLTGSQRTPGFWGVTVENIKSYKNKTFVNLYTHTYLVVNKDENIGFDGYIGNWILRIYRIYRRYIGGYFYMNIDISEINKNTLKLMETLYKSVK